MVDSMGLWPFLRSLIAAPNWYLVATGNRDAICVSLLCNLNGVQPMQWGGAGVFHQGLCMGTRYTQ